jgi:hypothetical protein
MFTVELYAKVRRAVIIEGLSRREAALRSAAEIAARLSPKEMTPCQQK